MSKKTNIISVRDILISITSFHEDDYICITDMAKAKAGESRAADVIKNRIRNRSTLEFSGTWETLYNSNFKVVEVDHFKMQVYSMRTMATIAEVECKTIGSYHTKNYFPVVEYQAGGCVVRGNSSFRRNCELKQPTKSGYRKQTVIRKGA